MVLFFSVIGDMIRKCFGGKRRYESKKKSNFKKECVWVGVWKFETLSVSFGESRNLWFKKKENIFTPLGSFFTIFGR